jgi:hypothetical protein
MVLKYANMEDGNKIVNLVTEAQCANMDDKSQNVPNAPSKVLFLNRYVKVVYQKY